MKFDELYHLKANGWQPTETPEKRKVSMEQCGGQVQDKFLVGSNAAHIGQCCLAPSPCAVFELGLTSITLRGPCLAPVQHAARCVVEAVPKA